MSKDPAVTPVLHEYIRHLEQLVSSMTGATCLAHCAVYNALTATAKKLANKPDFLQDIRQRFPHIAASTERLLASVEQQQQHQGPCSEPPGLSGDASCGLEARGGQGPMGTLAAAVAVAQQSHHAAQQEQRVGGGATAGMSRLGPGRQPQLAEEETTMQLYSQVAGGRAVWECLDFRLAVYSHSDPRCWERCRLFVCLAPGL